MSEARVQSTDVEAQKRIEHSSLTSERAQPRLTRQTCTHSLNLPLLIRQTCPHALNLYSLSPCSSPINPCSPLIILLTLERANKPIKTRRS